MPEPTAAPLPTPADPDVVDYVRSSARLLGLPLDAPQVQRVAVHLTRTRALAAALAGFDMAADAEPAELYCPAPFPALDPADDPAA